MIGFADYQSIISADDALLVTLFEADEADICEPRNPARGEAAWLIGPKGEIHPVEYHDEGAQDIYGIYDAGRAMKELGVAVAWELRPLPGQTGQPVLYFSRIRPLNAQQVSALKKIKNDCGHGQIFYTRW